jgi:hydrogenase maturation protease
MIDERRPELAWNKIKGIDDRRPTTDDRHGAAGGRPSVVGRPWSVVVIGYGNDLRGDDAVGMRVAAAVAGWRLAGMRVFAVRQLTPELAETLAAACMAVFVDACAVSRSTSEHNGGPHVEIHPLVPDAGASALGHASDPRQLLALSQALYGTYPRSWLVTVPAATFRLGEPLSPTAAAGVRAALHAIRRLISNSGESLHGGGSGAAKPPPK